MTAFNRISIIALTTLIFVLGACSTKIQKEVQLCNGAPCPTPTPTTGVALSCGATVAGPIAGGTSATINITASGGTGPYSTTGVSSFTSTASLQKSYPGSSQLQIVDDKVTVADSAGNTKDCTYKVTVYPPGTTNLNGIGCTLTASSASPKIGEPVNFTMMAIGGSSSYTFDFDPKNGFNFYHGNYTAGSTATASATYSGAGVVTPTLTVHDSNYQATTCSQTLNVRNLPSVSLTASPSTAAAVGGTITLTATGSDFMSASTTYTFSSSDPNVVVTASGSSATVHPNDQLYHTARISVHASNNGDFADRSVDVTFSVQNLSCQVALATPSAPIYINDDVTFNVTSSTGNLEIQTFDPGYGGSLVSGLASPVRVHYTSGGGKTIVVTARDATSRTPCNNGQTINLPITVRSPVACTAIVPQESTNGQAITVGASIPQGYGYTGNNIRIISVNSSAAGNFEVLTSPAGLAWTGRFRNQGDGSFPVYVSVKDYDDPQQRTADCPVVYHHSVIRNPICGLAWTDPDGIIISGARAHDLVRLKTTNLNPVDHGFEYLQISAPVTVPPPTGYVAVTFPNITPGFRLTQNSAGYVDAAAAVKADPYGPAMVCGARLTVSDALACSLSKPSRVGNVNNWRRDGSAYDSGTIALSQGNYDGGGYGNVVANITMNAFNKAGNVSYTFNPHNGGAAQGQISANASVLYQPQYPYNGVYPLTASLVDSFDPIGNTCALNDADKHVVANRLIVDTTQSLHYTRPTGPNGYNYFYYNSCKINVTNSGNRNNAVYVNGSLLRMNPGETKSYTVYGHTTARTCDATITSAGDRTFYPGTDVLTDGPQRFDVSMTVDYYAYAPDWSFHRVQATYNAHGM